MSAESLQQHRSCDQKKTSVLSAKRRNYSLQVQQTAKVRQKPSTQGSLHMRNARKVQARSRGPHLESLLSKPRAHRAETFKAKKLLVVGLCEGANGQTMLGKHASIISIGIYRSTFIHLVELCLVGFRTDMQALSSTRPGARLQAGKSVMTPVSERPSTRQQFNWTVALEHMRRSWIPHDAFCWALREAWVGQQKSASKVLRGVLGGYSQQKLLSKFCAWLSAFSRQPRCHRFL